jgi:hypothetical protein
VKRFTEAMNDDRNWGKGLSAVVDIQGFSAQSGPGGPNGVFPGGFFTQPSLMWEFQSSSSISTSPALGLDGTVYVGSDDGKLHALAGDTGKKKWSLTLSGANGDALTSPALLGMNAVLPLVVRGRIEAARGDPRAAATLDEAARHAEGVEDVVMVAPVTDAQSELALWSGDAERARDVARQMLAQIPPFGINEFLVGRLAYRLWRAGGDDPLPKLTAEPFRLMIEGDWAAAAAEWERRGATYLRAGIVNYLSSEADVDRMLDALRRLSPQAADTHPT